MVTKWLEAGLIINVQKAKIILAGLEPRVCIYQGLILTWEATHAKEVLRRVRIQQTFHTYDLIKRR